MEQEDNNSENGSEKIEYETIRVPVENAEPAPYEKVFFVINNEEFFNDLLEFFPQRNKFILRPERM